MGANVVLIEPSGHVGGMMTEGGIGLRDGKKETRLHDPRNSQVRWGLRNAKFYGIDDGRTIWQPDSSVGEQSFLELLDEAGVEVRGFTRVLLAKRVKMQALIICSLLSLSNLVRIHSFA